MPSQAKHQPILARILRLCARLRQLMGERGVSRKAAKARPVKIATEPDRRSFPDELAAVIEQSPLALQDKQKLVDHFKRTGKHAADMTLTELRRAREAAGLSLGQAATLLGMERHTLENIEHGAWNPSVEQLAAMNRVYGLAKRRAA